MLWVSRQGVLIYLVISCLHFRLSWRFGQRLLGPLCSPCTILKGQSLLTALNEGIALQFIRVDFCTVPPLILQHLEAYGSGLVKTDHCRVALVFNERSNGGRGGCEK